MERQFYLTTEAEPILNDHTDETTSRGYRQMNPGKSEGHGIMSNEADKVPVFDDE